MQQAVCDSTHPAKCHCFVVITIFPYQTLLQQDHYFNEISSRPCNSQCDKTMVEDEIVPTLHQPVKNVLFIHVIESTI